MYSVVLMMAMTGGGDVPAGLFGGGCGGGHHGGGCSGSCYGGCTGGHTGKHHRRSGGCCGGYASCYGGYSGCWGSGYGCTGGCSGCSGGHGGKHHRNRGCGCCGSYAYSCHGGSYGSSYGGCWGGSGYGGCVGGAIAPVVPGTPVVPATPSTPTTPPVTPKKTSIDGAAPATLVINVPADARVTIDGEATFSTSTERVFVTPELNPGREYHYTLKAEFTQDGQTLSVTKEVAVKAGNQTRVTIDASMGNVASR